MKDAGDSDSNTGAGIVPTGAVAGFSMPTLRYYVGNSSNTDINQLTNISVQNDAENEFQPIVLRWKETAKTRLYRVEIEDDANKKVFSAIVLPPGKEYQLPSFIRQLTLSKQLKWRVAAIGDDGITLQETVFTNVK